MEAKLIDHSEDGNSLDVNVVVIDGTLFISPKGYGECEAADGDGAPIAVEVWEGRLRVVTWPDINNEAPRIIDMEGARESKRIPDEDSVLAGVDWIGGVALATREQVKYLRRIDAAASPEMAGEPYDDQDEIRDWNIINEGEGIILESHDDEDVARKQLKVRRTSCFTECIRPNPKR